MAASISRMPPTQHDDLTFRRRLVQSDADRWNAITIQIGQHFAECRVGSPCLRWRYTCSRRRVRPRGR